MKNKKILASLLLVTLGATGLGLSSSFADDTNNTTENTQREFRMKGKGFGGHMIGGGHMVGGGYMLGKMNNLTEAEQTALESMTNEEKKDFFETKRDEREATRVAHENVIDKLLAGESLTSAEEITKNEIIERRAEMKVQREARELERAEMKTIFDKVQAGEDLTDEEQAKLDEKKGNKRGGGKLGRGGNRGK